MNKSSAPRQRGGERELVSVADGPYGDQHITYQTAIMFRNQSTLTSIITRNKVTNNERALSWLYATLTDFASFAEPLLPAGFR